MSLIVCPNCKSQISDDLMVCTFCNKPLKTRPLDTQAIGRYTPHANTSMSESISDGITRADINKASADINEAPYDIGKAPTEVPKKKTHKAIVIIGIILLLALISAVTVFFILKNRQTNITVDNIEFGSLIFNADGSTHKEITSSQKETFVAVIDEQTGLGNNTMLTLMQNGRGSIPYSSGSNYVPLGYITGQTVDKDSFLKSIVYNLEYYDSDLYGNVVNKQGNEFDHYAVKFVYELETYNNESGILFFESIGKNDLTSKINTAVICNGKGCGYETMQSYNKISEEDTKKDLVPIYFIPASQLTDNDYSESLYNNPQKTISSNSQTVKWNMERTIYTKNISNGCVLYTVTMNEAPDTKITVPKTYYGLSMISGGQCNIKHQDTFQFSDYNNKVTENSIFLSPKYDINYNCYLTWEKFKSEQSADHSEINFGRIVTSAGLGSQYYSIAKDGSYLSINTKASNNNSFTKNNDNENEIFLNIQKINKMLGFSEALFKKMSITSSSDGLQTDENSSIKVYWKYHPDNGMEIIYEKK